MDLYKFKKGDIFKYGTGDTAYEVVKDESITGIVWAVIAGSEGGRFRFSNKYDDLNLIAPAEDEYEYAVIMSTPKSGDHKPDPEEWGSRAKAEKVLREELEDHEKRIRYQRANHKPFEDWKFRIVKRRKAGKIEEL